MMASVLSAVAGCWIGGVAAFIVATVFDWRRYRRAGRPVQFLRCAANNLPLLTVPVVTSAAVVVVAALGASK